MSNPEDGTDFGAIFDSAFDDDASPAPETAPEPALPSEELAEPQAETAEQAATRQRDERGRFTQKVSSPPDAPPPADAPPAASAEPTPPPATEGTTPAPTGPDVSQYPPFEYAAGQRQLRVDGAVVDENGSAFFPKESVQHLRRLLADAHEAANTRANLGRAVAEAKREGEEMIQRGHKMVGRMDEIFGQGEIGSEAWENAVLQFALNWAREKPRMEAEARAQIAEARRQELETQVQARERDEHLAALTPQKYAAIDEWTQTLASRLGFSATDITKLQQRYRGAQWFERLFEEQDGQVMIVHELIDRDLQEMKQFYRPAPAPVAPRPATPPPPTAAGRASAPAQPGRKPAGKPDPSMNVRERDRKVFAELFED